MSNRLRAAVLLSLALCPLAGCDRQDPAVSVNRYDPKIDGPNPFSVPVDLSILEDQKTLHPRAAAAPAPAPATPAPTTAPAAEGATTEGAATPAATQPVEATPTTAPAQ